MDSLDFVDLDFLLGAMSRTWWVFAAVKLRVVTDEPALAAHGNNID
jgi:hypothetical protein